jgi:hypothetical protein
MLSILWSNLCVTASLEEAAATGAEGRQAEKRLVVSIRMTAAMKQ